MSIKASGQIELTHLTTTRTLEVLNGLRLAVEVGNVRLTVFFKQMTIGTWIWCRFGCATIGAVLEIVGLHFAEFVRVKQFHSSARRVTSLRNS